VNAFPQELRSKRIYRIAGGYVVSAWLVLQVASVIAPSLGLPAWTLRALLGILLLGFSVALFAGWHLDVRAAKATKLPVNFHLMVWPTITLFLLGGVILVLTVWFNADRGERTTPVGVKLSPASQSIAVLPFESLSENKSDTYFADGVQDEILSDLAKVSELKVISRTSVMTYRPGSNRDLRSIAEALSVAYVVEGTVRRNNNRVRITTELIDARTDETLWSESYDRDLTDIFAIQSEIAQTVASKLRAQLSPEERKDIEERPTNNLEAYDLYLQAKKLIARESSLLVLPGVEPETFSKGIKLLEEATQKDPKFALAYCMIARAHDFLYSDLLDHTPERRALGDAAVNEALSLRPDLPAVHLAAAFHLYAGYRDFERARLQTAIAARDLSNDADLLELTAMIDRKQGRWDKSTANLERAASFDPRNFELLASLVTNYNCLRRYRDAERIYNLLIEYEPDQPLFKTMKADVEFNEKADVKRARAAYDALPPSMNDDAWITIQRIFYASCDRDWTAAKEIFDKSPDEEISFTGVIVPRRCTELFMKFVQGNRPTMEEFGPTREQLYRKVEADPTNPLLLSVLAQVDAALGRKEEAIQEARRAVEMRPISEDAEDGALLVWNLASIYAWADETDMAFEQIDILRKTPNSFICYGDLKSDPGWDPLRKDPRFDKLLAELAPHN
jgi:TolB-like protein/Tfp pilus assembly protein PilF